MLTVKARTLGAAWRAACRRALAAGARTRDGDERLRELLHLTLVVERPDASDAFIERHADPAVLDWMRGNFEVAGPVPELGGAASYGARLRDCRGRDQLAWVVARLRAKPQAKSATISTLLGDDEAYVPCVSLLDFKLRAGRLILSCACRSIDLGRKLPANLVCLAAVQRDVAAALGRPVGALVLWMVSAHLDERDAPAARALARAGRRAKG